MSEYQKQIQPWLEANRPFTAAEIRAAGIPSQVLVELHQNGIIERLSRGVYLSTHAEITENLSLQVAALKFPAGVFCLLSALRFHDFTTQLPQEIYLAVKAHCWIPRNVSPEMRFYPMTEASFFYGIEEHEIDGVKIRVYSAAKTVADCFKYRNKIGQDIALEALRDGCRRNLFSVTELMSAAKVCRVTKIITPYLESIFS